MKNVEDIVLETHSLTEEQLLQVVSTLKIVDPADATTVGQINAVITEKVLEQQLPATIAIKSSETLLARIQDINRKLLPLHTDHTVDSKLVKKRTFNVRTSDGNVRPIQCIYNTATPDEVEFFMKHNGLVPSKYNNHLIKYMKNNIGKFNYFWIRRKVYNDGKWYLMLQVEYKG